MYSSNSLRPPTDVLGSHNQWPPSTQQAKAEAICLDQLFNVSVSIQAQTTCEALISSGEQIMRRSQEVQKILNYEFWAIGGSEVILWDVGFGW